MKYLVLLVGESLDCGGESPYEDAVVAHWDKLEVPSGTHSLPGIVDRSAEMLGSEYIDWCGALARVRVGKDDLAAALRSDLLAGGSFWWATLIAQRSPMASPVIYDLFKLRALENLYVSGGCQGLFCRGADARLEAVLRRWCEQQGHEFRSEHSKRNTSRIQLPVKRWFKRLPHPLRALVFLCHFLLSRRASIFRLGRLRAAPLRGADLAIAIYFPEINLAAAKTGEFRSNFLGPLHDLIRELGLKVNWIWIFSQTPQMSYWDSVAFQRALNRRTEASGQRYLMLEDGLRLSSVLSAIRAYLQLTRSSFSLEHCREYFRFPGGTLNFFDYLQVDWYSSLRGIPAMEMCLYASALRTLVHDLPATTKRMVYIWENQGWELSLLHAWRGKFSAPALGFIHSYNLTAVLNLRTYADRDPIAGRHCRPHPDKLVTIGKVPSSNLQQHGWPADLVTEAEALRYTTLDGKYASEHRALPDTGRHLLVITGYMHSETEAQLRLLAAAAKLGALRTYSQVTIKPHANTPADKMLADFTFDPAPRVTNTPLSELFAEADVIFAANSTSAAIEAAWVGLPVISMAALGEINLSPLKGMEGVDFVATAAELEKQLFAPAKVGISADCYCFNPGVARWRALLLA